MNKDVIYIEPEDDITDIISKLKSAEEKVVALVPPKNIGVMRSAVNTKLIAKTAKLNDKVAVVITTDPSLIKLSAVAGLPVADNLRSRPKLPTDFTAEELNNMVGPISIDERKLDDAEDDAPEKPAAKSEPTEKAKAAGTAKKPAATEMKSDDLEKDDKKKSDKKGKKIPDFDKYRKWIILGAIGFVLLVGFIIWATLFAPAAKIAVNVRTTADNFSENVSFVTEESKADPKKGVFYLETQEYKQDSSVEFQATGSKDVGEKAKGTLNVSVYVQDDTYSIPAGAEFKTGDLSYTADSGATINFNDDSHCANPNGTGPATIKKEGCLLSASVNVTATAPGEKYNVTSSRTWTSGLSGKVNKITNASAFSGGTTKTAIIVQQSDVDNAKSKLEAGDEAGGKEELTKQFGDDMMVIESSYSVESTNIASNPAVGAEVSDGTTPKLSAATIYKMSAVKKSSVEKYIKKLAKADLSSDQKLYSIGNPFFEKFSSDDKGNATAKLKTTTQAGPKITEEDVLEKVKGKKTGEVQTLIKSINGVSSVKVDPSFFWVTRIPTDPNRIQIELKVEE
ncbi:hypothetical protein IJJ18_03545 [Candidatus Saccharibacteria bacterium]|nr:hypothetical protein [Candidatus Saccharibacteria bacterium]